MAVCKTESCCCRTACTVHNEESTDETQLLHSTDESMGFPEAQLLISGRIYFNLGKRPLSYNHLYIHIYVYICVCVCVL